MPCLRVQLPAPVVESLPAIGLPVVPIVFRERAIVLSILRKDASVNVSALGFSMTVPSDKVARVFTPMSMPTDSPVRLSGAVVPVFTPIDTYQRTPSLLTTAVVISPANLSLSRIFTQPIRGSLILRPHTLHGATPVVRLVAVVDSALAPAGKADVSCRPALSQGTSAISPSGDLPADAAYGLFGSVLAEMGSRMRVLSCVRSSVVAASCRCATPLRPLPSGSP